MEWKYILEIPRRKKGMTSSGEPQECHQNVNKFVNTIGGNALRGYWITENLTMQQGLPVEDIKFVEFSYHSMWITPEGNATDVTMRGYEDTYEPWFIPLYETSDHTMIPWVDIRVDENWLKEGLWVSGLADIVRLSQKISRAQFRKYADKFKSNVRRDWTDDGKGFSKPSNVSKMSFDEFEKLYRDQRKFIGFGKRTKPSRITDAVKQIKS